MPPITTPAHPPASFLAVCSTTPEIPMCLPHDDIKWNVNSWSLLEKPRATAKTTCQQELSTPHCCVSVDLN